MKSYLVLFALVVAVLFGAASWGQGPQPGDDPIAQNLFPPELVMKYSQEINLDEGQSKAIKEAIHNSQAKFLDMQWEMQSEA